MPDSLPARPAILYMGTPEFAVPALRALADGGHQLVGVVTQPDRRSGRGLKRSASPVKRLALERDLPVFQPASVKDRAFQEQVRGLAPDLIVVVAFGLIIPREILEVPCWGAFNVHASLLPRYRGAAPIQWAILNGESLTGLSLMRMDEGLDTGPVLFQEESGIREKDSAGDLHDRLAAMSGPFLLEALERMSAGRLTETPQDESGATYAPKITSAMTVVDWRQPASRVAALIRALDPAPGARTTWNGRPLKLFGATEEADAGGTPGRVLEVGERLLVETGRGMVAVSSVQAPGRKRMGVAEFLRGAGLEAGVLLGI